MSLILSGTDGLSDVDGTAATPAIRGTDTNTGIFFPAADTVAASVGGTEGLRLTSTGLGVGTSTPAVKLDVVGTTTSGIRLRSSSGAANGFNIYNDSTTDIAYLTNFYNGSMVFGINNAEQMRLTSTGLGVGTSSPAYAIHAAGNVNGNVTVASNNTSSGTSAFSRFLALADAGNAQFGMTSSAYTDITGATDALLLNANNASGGMAFALDGVLRMKLDSSGNLGIGTSSPDARLTIASAGRGRWYRSDNTRFGDVFMDSDGFNVVAQSAGDNLTLGSLNVITFRTASSERARITSGCLFTTMTAQTLRSWLGKTGLRLFKSG
jgi:hypothetical protein